MSELAQDLFYAQKRIAELESRLIASQTDVRNLRRALAKSRKNPSRPFVGSKAVVLAVFNVPELAEAIFSHLDIPGLLRAQQACKLFQTVSSLVENMPLFFVCWLDAFLRKSVVV